MFGCVWPRVCLTGLLWGWLTGLVKSRRQAGYADDTVLMAATRGELEAQLGVVGL